MRKLSFIFTIFFTMNIVLWASVAPSTYTEMFDNNFRFVSKTQATTGILYDRVVPFADF